MIRIFNKLQEHYPSLYINEEKQYTSFYLSPAFHYELRIQKKVIRMLCKNRPNKAGFGEAFKVIRNEKIEGKKVNGKYKIIFEAGVVNPEIFTLRIEIPYIKEDLTSDEFIAEVISSCNKFHEKMMPLISAFQDEPVKKLSELMGDKASDKKHAKNKAKAKNEDDEIVLTDFDISDEFVLNNLSDKIKGGKYLTNLFYINNALSEKGYDMDTHQAYFFDSRVLISDREMEGFLVVNMDGFYSNCVNEDEITSVFSWSGVNDIEYEEDGEDCSIDIVADQGRLTIKKEGSHSLKILYTFYKHVWEAINDKFKDEPFINWNDVWDMGISEMGFDRFNDYYTFAKGNDDELPSKATAKTSDSFKTVKIGKQEWMVENLNVDHFRNGDLIQEAKTNKEWIEAGNNGQAAWCYYENDSANGKTYGKLYNWYAVNDPRGLAPEGWRVPNETDWNDLIDFSGGEKVARDRMKTGNFSALPGGIRLTNGQFFDLGKDGGWWSGDEGNNEEWSICLNYKDHDNPKECGLSVRCVIKEKENSKNTKDSKKTETSIAGAEALAELINAGEELDELLQGVGLTREDLENLADSNSDDTQSEEIESEEVVGQQFLFEDPNDLIAALHAIGIYFRSLDSSEEFRKLYDQHITKFTAEVIVPRISDDVIRVIHEQGAPVDTLVLRALFQIEAIYDKEYETHRDFIYDINRFITEMIPITDNLLKMQILSFFMGMGNNLDEENSPSGNISFQDRYFPIFLSLLLWPEMEVPGLDDVFFKSAGKQQHLTLSEKVALVIYDFILIFENHELEIKVDDISAAQILHKKITRDSNSSEMVAGFEDNFAFTVFQFFNVWNHPEKFHEMCLDIWQSLREELNNDSIKTILTHFEKMKSDKLRADKYLPSYKN